MYVNLGDVSKKKNLRKNETVIIGGEGKKFLKFSSFQNDEKQKKGGE